MSNLTRQAMRDAEKRRAELTSYYSSQFCALFHNSIKVENLPEDLPKRYLLKELYEHGAIAYDKETKLYLPFSAIGINQYGLPTRYNLIRYVGGSMERDANEVVILRMNDIQQNIKFYIDVNIKKLVDIDMAIEQNLDAIKTMTLIEVENHNTLMSLDNMNLARRVGASVVFVNKGSGSVKLGDTFKATNTGAEYLVDRLQENRRHILNETFSILGTALANTEKKERVQGMEILASENYALDMLNTGIDTFNYDAKVGNLDIRLVGNTNLVRVSEVQLENMEGENNG